MSINTWHQDLQPGLNWNNPLEVNIFMDTDKQAQIKAHALAIASLLYDETAPEQLETLEGIEEAVRSHILEHVSPEIGNFLLAQLAAHQADASEPSIASSGN
jgi:hypothetical protein